MFLTHRPTVLEIEEFLTQSRDLPLSYQPVGLVNQPSKGFKLDTAAEVIGQGQDAFARARQALRAWRQFELGWVELFPPAPPNEVGTVVAVLIRHQVLWSFKGCRVVYTLDDDSRDFNSVLPTER